MRWFLSAQFVVVPVYLALAPPAFAAPPTAQDLRSGPWQFDLHGTARSLPIGLAFKRGITATVVTFKEDGTLRMDIPCRNEEFLRSIGGEFRIDGTWELVPPSELRMTTRFRGEQRTESYSASLENEELLLSGTAGSKRLGRFMADLTAACLYE